MIEGHKRCPGCATTKPHEDFSKRTTTRDGLDGHCKACNLARVKRNMASPGYKEKKAAYDKDYVAKNALRLRTRAKIRYYRNSQLRVRKSVEWARKNPELRRAIANAYKARRRGQWEVGMSGPEMRGWLEKQILVCEYCGTVCQDNFHIDHIHPLSKGGRHDEDNLTIACATCNQRKSNKMVLMFLLDQYQYAPAV